MSISGVSNDGTSYYHSSVSKTDTEQTTFSLDESEEKVQKSESEEKKFPGNTLAELFEALSNGKVKANSIPVVNQIVSAKNPEDGKIYLTCFTDQKITCIAPDGSGKKVWEMEITPDQADKVKDFFAQYTPSKWAKEYYSGEELGQATTESFWHKLFEKRDVYERTAVVGETEQLPSEEDVTETEKVTDIGVASLPNGVSFYFNNDTGEVSCVNDHDSRPGRQVMWRKMLSSEEMARCDKLFDNYKDETAGHFVFRYKAYLKHEKFWDMYLDGRVDLSTLIQEDAALSDDELYNNFLRDMANKDH